MDSVVQDSLHVAPPADKLRLLRSPIHPEDNVDDGSGSRSTTGSMPGLMRPSNPREVERIGYRYNPEDFPLLRRNEDATNLEVFYDLFLACLNLFNRNQQMESMGGLSAYVGFFSLLWTTWFLTSAYDVRFVTDSIFERCCRAVHLGVLVGFVTVSPNFNFARQDPQVFRTFTLILMVSRLCLGLEYGSIFLQAWRYKKTRWQLATMSGLNFFNGLIYMVVSFRFNPDSSRLFISWYGLCTIEVVTVIFIAVTYPILSFQGTPLIRRLSLLTLIIFGEGITVACGNITEIVNAESHSAWTPNTIGTVTACISITYLAFMLYFDSVKSFQLPPWRQIAWTILHFPLHLALTLFTEGCAQFIIFWKSVEFEQSTMTTWGRLISDALDESTADFAQPFRDWLDGFFDARPRELYYYRDTLNDTLRDLSSFGGDSRDALRDAFASRNATRINEVAAADPAILDVMQGITAMVFMVINVASTELGLDFYDDELKQQQGVGDDGQSALSLGTMDLEVQVSFRTFYRMRVVFQYMFACGGGFIALLAILTIVGRVTKWTRWAVARTVISLVIAVGIGLVAALSQFGRDIPLSLYLSTPLVLPPLTILFFLLLVLHHLPEDPLSRCLSARRWGKRGGRQQHDEKRNESGPEQDHDPEEDVDGRDVESASIASEAREDGSGDPIHQRERTTP